MMIKHEIEIGKIVTDDLKRIQTDFSAEAEGEWDRGTRIDIPCGRVLNYAEYLTYYIAIKFANMIRGN